jgi:CO dehydrogenase/acetyl-CoA synthase epsilon subunit
MKKFNASDCGRYIRAHQNPLILAGDGCDHIKLDDKMLADYAADFAVKLNCQVAATGNTINGMIKRQGVKVRKAWLVELITSLKGEWVDPILPERPDLLIFIGYRPEMIDGIIAGLDVIGTVHLGPGKSLTAEHSMEAGTFSEWKNNLDALIGSIG